MKSIIVRLKKTRHKSQPWTFEIDMPGPQGKQTKLERYATQYSAKRGALRQLRTEEKHITPCSYYAINGKVRKVTFILDARKVTKAITNPKK